MNFSFSNVVIEAIDHIIPPQIIASEDIERQLHDVYTRLHLSLGRLELMTGIKERRAWREDILPSQASTLAAEKVLKKTKLDKQNIDLIIHASVCRDRLEPATAAYVHRNLNLSPHTLFWDLSNACLGFMNAIVAAASMIESKQIRSALIVSGENGKPLLEHTLSKLRHDTAITRQEIKPYFANLTIGSGAVAAIICHDSLAEKSRDKIFIKTVSSCSNSDGCTLCQGDSHEGGLVMETDSEALLKLGVALAQRNWEQFLQYNQLTSSDIRHIICHQVGHRHRLFLYQTLGIDLAKDFSTFPSLGNTGSVALPMTLSLAIEENILHSKEKVALLGIGSGASSLMMLVERA